MQEELIKRLAKELLNEIKTENLAEETIKIDGLEKNKSTRTTRIYEVTLKRLIAHCLGKVYSPVQFASIAIEEKLNRINRHSPKDK